MLCGECGKLGLLALAWVGPLAVLSGSLLRRGLIRVLGAWIYFWDWCGRCLGIKMAWARRAAQVVNGAAVLLTGGLSLLAVMFVGTVIVAGSMVEAAIVRVISFVMRRPWIAPAVVIVLWCLAVALWWSAIVQAVQRWLGAL